MSNPNTMSQTNTPAPRTMVRVQAGLAKRYARERRFKWMGIGAVIAGLFFLSLLFTSIIANGYTAFWQTYMHLEIELAADELDPHGSRDPKVLSSANYGGLVKVALRKQFPEVKSRSERRKLYDLVSS